MPSARCCYCGVTARPSQRFRLATALDRQRASELRSARGAPPHAAALHVCPTHQRHPLASENAFKSYHAQDMSAVTAGNMVCKYTSACLC